MKKTILLVLPLLVLLLGAASCGSGAPSGDVAALNEELSAVKGQLQDATEEIARLRAANETLQGQYDALKGQPAPTPAPSAPPPADGTLAAQLAAAESKYQALKADYDKLSDEYDDLLARYEATGGPAPALAPASYTAEDVEQLIFQMVNDERAKSGLDPLEMGPNLYKWAQQNSQNMADKGDLVYSDYGAFQALYRAVGYSTAEKVATAALTIWRTTNQYDRQFLNSGTKYGAVGVYKGQNIYYITYIADYFR